VRVIDGRQIAAARALANVSVIELARAAGVTPRTIGRLEIDAAIAISPKRRHGHVAQSTIDKITTALAQRGVELIAETKSTGSGARWALPRDQRG
jgi:hypothetical protein